MGEEATLDSAKELTVKRISMPVDHSLHSRLEPESIRVLLPQYNDNFLEVKGRASQLAQECSVLLEPAGTVGLTFCINEDQLEFAVECVIIPDCTSAEALTDEPLR